MARKGLRMSQRRSWGREKSVQEIMQSFLKGFAFLCAKWTIFMSNILLRSLDEEITIRHNEKTDKSDATEHPGFATSTEVLFIYTCSNILGRYLPNIQWDLWSQA